MLNKIHRKAWSLLLYGDQKYKFLIVDTPIGSNKCDGLNLFELHELILRHFDFERAVILDGGQSSKMYVNGNGQSILFGNAHYMDYNQVPYGWNGLHGRKMPTALIAYAKI